MLVDFAFNGSDLTREFPRFTEAVINNDYATMRHEHRRFITHQQIVNGNLEYRNVELGERNRLFHERYLINEEDIWLAMLKL